MLKKIEKKHLKKIFLNYLRKILIFKRNYSNATGRAAIFLVTLEE